MPRYPLPTLLCKKKNISYKCLFWRLNQKFIKNHLPLNQKHLLVFVSHIILSKHQIFFLHLFWPVVTQGHKVFDSLQVWFSLEEMKYLLKCVFPFLRSVSRHSAALSCAKQHTTPTGFGGKWATQCLNTVFPLSTLLYSGYSVKLIYLFLHLFYFRL